ncbi:MAG: amino acid adenylation domain-containing protein [Flavipsychrobacter sp.]|nr:amino acid adenylation domain-containing protein [Flavipsychrobacter sp.]
MNSVSIVKGAIRPDLIHDETLVDMFRTSAQKFAGKTALIFGDKSLTYAEVDKWSDAVAAYLVKQGIVRGNKVGLWWARSLEMHIAVLGIIKAGASYVPLDREMPAERVITVLNEVNADGYFSQDALNTEKPIFTVVPQPPAKQNFQLTEGPLPDNWAYVLYTSGSTGTPKGIPISHRQITHLVRSENSIFHVTDKDRVYQGFSVSFDMWCEETWVSYFAGATIWVADAATAKSIDELGDVLRKERITILHAVPSLLAVMDDEIPSIRLINAGGEACTPQVLSRWSTPHRHFYNSYGPTETTVSATMALLNPGDAITIGLPLPNYDLAVVDEKMNPVPYGERGELVITGPGVCEGYVNRPQLTIEKFLDKPASLSVMNGDRVYKTGDAAIINPNGTIDFYGRLDDQIKLRGYRIELGEIENKLNNLPGISAAAVAVKKDNNDQEQLVGYVLAEDLSLFNEGNLRSELGKVLPSYMVPAVIMLLPEMPRLPSGKIDRKKLPVPASLMDSPSSGPEDAIDPNAPIGDRVLAALRKVFPNRNIDLSMDFFTDLGGHSLLAAIFVSKLRKEGNATQASLKDIYQKRPLQALVTEWEHKAQIKPKKEKVFHKIPTSRYVLCTIAQTIALLVIFGLFAIQIFLPYLGYYYVEQDTNNLTYAIVTALTLFCFIAPIFGAISIGAKWLIIGRMKEGDYPLWGVYYFRWWLVKTLLRLMPVQFITATPLYPVYLRMLGVKVAPDAQIANLEIGAEDLVTLGSDVSLSSQVVLNNAVVEDGMLKLRRITLGDHAYIGSSAIIAGDTVIEDWGELQDLSFLSPKSIIKHGEVWKGSPAVMVVKKTAEELPQPIHVSEATRRKYKIIFSLLLLIFPFTILLPLLPTIITLNQMDNAAPDYNFTYMVVTPSLAVTYIILFTLETVLLTRLLQWGIKPGTYPIYSRFYLRKWFADQLMSLSLIVLHPIYATVYVSAFFKALGAKVGKNTEISTASSVTHPLLEIGKGSFIADAVTLGEADVRGQQLILERTVIGNTSFVGNSALIPQGYHLPDHMLIGVLSTPPDAKQLEETNAKNFFGSPAIALPRRQESHQFSLRLTTYPTVQRYVARSIVEFVRILIPETTILIFSILFIAYCHDLLVDEKWWQIMLKLPFYYLGIMGIPAFLVTVILKWITVGKYKEEQVPMWTSKVWRSEAITTTYEALAIPFFLDYLKGTAWLPLVLKLLGLKTGKRIYMNTTDITEFDMVSIGDDAALNEDSGPQTHLFEDRVMKVGKIKIGARTSIGARSIILYDSEIGDDVTVQPLSLVMKGENLPPATDWIGSPVRQE